jgi:hypothetical protein
VFSPGTDNSTQGILQALSNHSTTAQNSTHFAIRCSNGATNTTGVWQI